MSKPDVDRLREITRTLAVDLPGLKDPEALRTHPQFVEGVALLEDVKVKHLETLIRKELPAIVAMVAARAAQWPSVPDPIEEALRWRIDDGPKATLVLSLEALAKASAGYAGTWTLNTLFDLNWKNEPLRSALRTFVQARLDRGETIVRRDSLREHIKDVLADLLEAEAAPSSSSSFDESFFADLGRMIDPDAEVRLLRVGARAAAVDAIARALAKRKSVLIVGEHGVGKATIARAGLAAADGWRGFEAAASDVNAGMQYIGQLEGRVKEIAAKMKGRDLAWLFPGLEDAIWAGQHSRSPRGMLDALLPNVEAGEAVVIGQLSESAYEQLVRLRPKVAGAFEVVRVPALDEADTLAVAADWLDELGVSVPPGTLAEAYDLAGHYLANIAAPGSVLRLLEQALERDGDLLDTLAETTGLSMDLLDPRTQLDLERVRAFYETRVLGQSEAVDCLVERIALIKAGLTDPSRPLGVFLFVGPTGTGKTELAKATAELLFGAEERMIRLDMSEFQNWDSHERLLDDEGVLIPSVRSQPFSVVLLDEFEKAHRSVWDLFLAVFDDGRLTDRGGRTTDFRHCVIILTSNVGSALPSGPGLGFAGDGGEDHADFHVAGVERAVRGVFRPELLNRFDRTVVFRPLGRDVMRALLENELRKVMARRGFRIQPWAVEWDEAALDVLLERGYTAELGARPMKRAIEQHLLAPLAAAIVGREFPDGDQFLFIGGRGDRLEVTFVDPDAPDDGPEPEDAPDPDYAEVGAQVKRALAAKDAALAETHAPDFWERPEEERRPVLERVEYLDRLQAAWETAGRLRGRGAARLLAARLHVLRAACEGIDAGAPIETTLELKASRGSEAWADDLRGMYAGWAKTRGMRLTDTDDGFVVSGLGAATILAPEAGLHVFEAPDRGGKTKRLSVQVVVGEDRSRRIVRRYRRQPSPLVRDLVRKWRSGKLDRILAGEFDLKE